MSEKILEVPLKDKDIRDLKIGDVVYLKGMIYTARDMAHLRMKEFYENNSEYPVDFNGSVIFHAGPVAKKNGDSWDLIVIGPTTSVRMEPYSELVGELGVKAIVGKGGMLEKTIENAGKYGYVYLQAPPGCGVTTTEGFKEISGVEWLDLAMPEALWKLDAVKFGPLVVSMDTHGKSIYKDIKENALKMVQEKYKDN